MLMLTCILTICVEKKPVIRRSSTVIKKDDLIDLVSSDEAEAEPATPVAKKGKRYVYFEKVICSPFSSYV